MTIDDLMFFIIGGFIGFLVAVAIMVTGKHIDRG